MGKLTEGITQGPPIGALLTRKPQSGEDVKSKETVRPHSQTHARSISADRYGIERDDENPPEKITFLVAPENARRLKVYLRGKERGAQVKFINGALADALDSLGVT